MHLRACMRPPVSAVRSKRTPWIELSNTRCAIGLDTSGGTAVEASTLRRISQSAEVSLFMVAAELLCGQSACVAVVCA